MRAALRENGDRVAVRDGDDELTHAELDTIIGETASALAAHGVGPGSVVGLSSGTSVTFVAVVFATIRLGASIAMISTSWRNSEVDHAVGLVRPTHLVHDGSSVVDFAAHLSEGIVVHVDDLVATEAVPEWARAGADDVAVYVFSSGTTGLPKAVRHTHRSLGAGMDHWIASLGLGPTDRLQITTPPFHILGLLNLLVVVAAGASVRLHRRFDLDAMLGAIQRDRITIEMAVAPIALAMANHADLERFDLSSLRYIMWGATPVTASVAETVTARTGIRFLPAYGASELPVLAANPVECPDDWRLDSVGMAPAGVELRVVDPETGAAMPVGQPGEIQGRSESVMLGYLPEAANGEAFADGWYRTGDIGTIDADGWVSITDRVKEMIKVKGFQVAPAEVEAVLLGHPAVADCAVFGVPDAASGEAVAAAVVVSPGADATADELQALVAESLSPYKRITHLELVDAVPRLPSGKVLRRELQAAHES